MTASPPAAGVQRPYRVLFLCTGNSARSILAEGLLTHWGHGRILAYSAGSHPKGAVHPLALAELRRAGLPDVGYRSKSWQAFAATGAPAMDVVVTVCDQAAGEACPIWPGAPVKLHWSIPDPAAADVPEPRRTAAFEAAYRDLEVRIRRLAEQLLTAQDVGAARCGPDLFGEDDARTC